MDNSRTLKAKHYATRSDVGNFATRVALPNNQARLLDPFLLLAHHGPQVFPPHNGGFPWGPHPHRGFETVTFVRAGSLAHGDTGGHVNVVHAGGVQWMTAGSGLLHAELAPAEFRRDGGPAEVLQLWVNLPSRLKMTQPRYIGVEADQIPEVPLSKGDGSLHLISGAFDGVSGPITSLTGVMMSTVELRAGGRASLPAPSGRTVFLYVVDGNGKASGAPFERWQLLEFEHDADEITLDAVSDVSLLFGHADPLREPVVTHGPFVMTTIEEVNEAIRDFKAGEFGQSDALSRLADEVAVSRGP